MQHDQPISSSLICSKKSLVSGESHKAPHYAVFSSPLLPRPF
jgi:hypothetical protein